MKTGLLKHGKAHYRFLTVFCLLSCAIIVQVAGCTATTKMMMASESNPFENDNAAVARGSVIYAKQCSECHGGSGTGDGPKAAELKVTPQNLVKVAQERSTKLIAITTRYGKGEEMPAFDTVLSREQIWEVSNFVHSLANN